MFMKSMKLLAVATTLALGSIAAQAQTEIVFAISAATGSLQEMTAAEFTRRANEKLGELATVKLFADSQLGKDKDLLQKLKLGTVHITLPSSIMPEIAAEFAVFDMPFLVKDRDHLARIEKDIFWSELAPLTEPKGYQVLAIWENGFRHMTNNERPINTPADLAGLKIRTPNSQWRVKMFSEWGANPTPMAFSEVFVGLQTGVIDGQENPYTNIWAAKLNEVQEYLSVTGHVYSPAYPTVGVSTWSKLPEDVQQILKETAMEMEIWARDAGAAAENDLRTKLEEAGMKINVADRQSFVEASTPIYEAFAAEVPAGKQLSEAALSLADQ